MNGSEDRAAPRPSKQERRDLVFITAGLVLLVAAVFGQTVGFGFVNFDDQVYVYENPLVRRGLRWDGIVTVFTTARAANWHPLTWMSHMADVSLFGLNPAAHHAVNVALHALNAALLFTFLRRATGATWRSAAVAALFAVHPLRAETVAWVSERKDVLSSAFLLCALHAWLTYVKNRTRGAYVAVAAWFTLSLLAKQTYVTFPFLLLVLDAWPLRRPWSRALVVEKLPFVALSVAASAAVWWAQSVGAAMVALDFVPLGWRVANALCSYAAYLGDALWPARLAAFYPHPILVGDVIPWWRIVVSTLLIAGISIAVAFAWRRRPYLAAGWLWYLGMLVPMIGVVQVGTQSRADRYTYVPLVGVFLALVWLAEEVASSSRWARWATAVGIAAATMALAVAGYAQVETWRDSETLYRTALSRTDRNWQAWTGLGDVLSESRRADEAIAAYEQAIRIRPEFADAWGGIGITFGRSGDTGRAISALRRAVQLNPRGAQAWYNLGTAYGMSGDHLEAARAFRTSVELNPEDSRAWGNLAVASLQLGDGATVLESITALRRIDPAEAAKIEAQLGGSAR